MYAVKGVSGEEWMFRALAMAMCLALVGLAILPISNMELTYWMAKQGASPEACLITDLGLGINGLILSTAFGMVSGGVGFAVGLAWLVGQSL